MAASIRNSPARAVADLIWPAGSRPGVACSGGVDSVLLLDLLHEHLRGTGIPLHVVHVDHGLRAGSEVDAAFVAELASRRGLPLALERLELEPEMAGSLEARARSSRYEAFGRLTHTHALTHLLLAHHRDDQVETVAMRVLRGSGCRGLRGIPRERALHGGCRILRPLLAVARQELVEAATARGLGWREDPSNADERHLRNRLRHSVLPELGRRSHFDAERILAIAREASRLHEEIEGWARPLRGRLLVTRAPGLLVLDADLTSTLPQALLLPVIRPLLAPLLPHGKLGRRTLTGIRRLLDSADRATVTLPGALHGERIEDRLYLVARSGDVHPAPLATGRRLPVLALGGALVRHEVRGLDRVRAILRHVRSRPWMALLARHGTRGSLHVRGRARGERMHPLGAPGSKLVSDLLWEAGVLRSLRNRFPILADEAGVLWVPGRPPAERARVGADCAEAAWVSWEPPPSALFGEDQRKARM